MVDLLLVSVPATILSIKFGFNQLHKRTIVPAVLTVVLFVVYETFFRTERGQTLRKMMRVRIRRADGSKLSWVQAFLRSCWTMAAGLWLLVLPLHLTRADGVSVRGASEARFHLVGPGARLRGLTRPDKRGRKVLGGAAAAWTTLTGLVFLPVSS